MILLYRWWREEMTREEKLLIVKLLNFTNFLWRKIKSLYKNYPLLTKALITYIILFAPYISINLYNGEGESFYSVVRFLGYEMFGFKDWSDFFNVKGW
ncbi:hypothetical protein AXI64_gp181 [Vibrio phage qdvp001]|uniref:hypothetical protein n=1 Tax=Vibrio phage qdvp001 TaxID=1003177 RepID=UPI000721996F|nr:hypothetical protein AXI64_gp181 [Vibrio phage qdvp001]ALM62173.1 hypothetical protein qdvp001_181 [Vibrio phage qdvp001]